MLTRLAVILCCWVLAGTAPAATEPPRLLERASVVVNLGGTAPASAATEVLLPYNWDTMVGAVDGRARFTLQFDASDIASAQAVYTRQVGNTFSMRLNGTEIARMDAKGRYEDFSREPRLYTIPAGLLQAHNTLEITIAAQGGRHAGLTPVMVGDAETLQAMYQRDYRWRVTGAMVISVISGVFGALALILWLRQHNPLFLLYGAGELLWAVQVSNTWLTHPPLPWPWWGVVVFSSYALAPVLICKFALEVIGRHVGWFKRWSDWQLLLSVPLVLLFMLGDMPWMWTVMQGSIVLLAIATATVVVARGLHDGALERRVLAIAVILTVAAAVRDFTVIKLIGSSYGYVSWARYAWVVFAMAMAWVIAEQMRKDGRALAQANQILAQELAAREAELQMVFERERRAEKSRGVQEERTRLMRDMHDGLGSQLLGVLQLAKSPAAPRAVLAAQLQDTLDHLKLTVDAMQEIGGDIGSLLGALRYRLAPRLQAAGIELSWEVEHLPLMVDWNIQHSRDLQMLLFEAFSNLIAHSGAKHAHLAAICANDEAAGPVVRITLGDNGTGFDLDRMAARRGHGIANMQTRATRLGAVLRIYSSVAGSRLQLVLPLQRSVDAESEDRARQPDFG